MFKCRLCGKCLSELQGSYLVRVNETGVPGIWECLPCCEAALSQDEALLASHLVDTEVVEKLNAGLKSYHERDAGEKHA